MLVRWSIGLWVVCSAALASAQPTSTPVQYWWPEHLDLGALRRNEAPAPSPEYPREFAKLDLPALKKDVRALLTRSQPWWPADYGHYGPFFIRMAWHSSGTYRVFDGRGGADGGQQRFEPLGSWPDNGNLDKARRLLWPIKQKYGQGISWADLMILASNVALEDMGVKTFGFAGGRRDDAEPDLVYWGPEKAWLTDRRHGRGGQLQKPLAAAQMGLIYVNPQGPNGRPDPLGSARDIREIFGRMAMNDEETVALIAGGHTFGKAHGAHRAERCLGPEPAAAGVESQGLGWQNRCGRGHGPDTVTSGLEGAWTEAPTQWSSSYLDNLFGHEWRKTKSPGGAIQWVPQGRGEAPQVPDAHDPQRRHPPIMLTSDLALRADPAYRKIAENFRQHPDVLQDAFARAWFKLTHRDMGPRSRYLGAEAPKEALLWQDPLPAPQLPAISGPHVAELKRQILAAPLSPEALVRLAWGAASSFRGTDRRGGANGARVRLEPQKSWAANSPEEAAATLSYLEGIAERFNQGHRGGASVSVADLVVLGGGVGIEQAAKRVGLEVEVPFAPGRTDALQSQTDVAFFAVLEPVADGFRNFVKRGAKGSPVAQLVERAAFLNLTVAEMTVLVGGLRGLNANAGQSSAGVLTQRPGTLTPDFFVNLLDMSTEWARMPGDQDLYEGVDRQSRERRWTATSVDLVFGSHAELRAVAETYAQADGQPRFVRDFVAAWVKVMNLDRFDLERDGQRS